MADKDVLIDIAGLKKDVENVQTIHGRLDTAIDRLADVSTSIKQMLAVHEEKITRQEQTDEVIFGKLRERQIEIAVQLFQKMGIERDDKEGRQDWVLRGFRQFDAPLSIVVTFDRELLDDDISKFDCGGIVNGLVTAGWSKGLGAVINSQGIMQSPVVREHA